jgi:hypothetical protein
MNNKLENVMLHDLKTGGTTMDPATHERPSIVTSIDTAAPTSTQNRTLLSSPPKPAMKHTNPTMVQKIARDLKELKWDENELLAETISKQLQSGGDKCTMAKAIQMAANELKPPEESPA